MWLLRLMYVCLFIAFPPLFFWWLLFGNDKEEVFGLSKDEYITKQEFLNFRAKEYKYTPTTTMVIIRPSTLNKKV